MRFIQHLLNSLTCQVKRGKIHQHQVIVCTTGYNPDSSVHQTLAKSLGIVNNVLLILLKVICKGFFEADSLGCDHMHQRTSLNAWEHCLIEVIFICGFLIAENHTASRSTQRFMRSCGYHISIRNRARMKSCCHKSCNVSHINHQYCPNLICNLTELLEINGSCISGCTGNDHFGLTLQCDLP